MSWTIEYLLKMLMSLMSLCKFALLKFYAQIYSRLSATASCTSVAFTFLPLISQLMLSNKSFTLSADSFICKNTLKSFVFQLRSLFKDIFLQFSKFLIHSKFPPHNFHNSNVILVRIFLAFAQTHSHFYDPFY